MTRLKSLVLICAMSMAFAVQAQWSQAAALEVVGQLQSGLEELVAMAGDGGGQADAVRNKFSHAALVDLRILVDELDKLDIALAAGKGKPHTYAQYQRISNLRDSIKDYVQDTQIPDEIKAKAETAAALLRKLDIMYVE